MADFRAWHLLELSETTWGVMCLTSSLWRLENIVAWSGMFTPNIHIRLLLLLDSLPFPLLPSTLGTCEASRFDSNLNRTSRFEFNSKVTCRFKNFELATHAVCRHTTNYAHSLFNKHINLCTVCSWDLCLQLHFTCSCTAVARPYTTPTWQSALNM